MKKSGSGDRRGPPPTIGEVPGLKGCHAVLGFGCNGITYSRIAADIIAAALAGRSDPDAGLYAIR